MMSVTNLEKLSQAIEYYENDEMDLAIPLFHELASNNCEESNLYLSLIYQDGDGVEKNELKARQCKKKYVDIIEEKAKQGDPYYRLKMGAILQYGDGIPVDEKQAFDIYFALANEGEPEAQFILYSIFTHGWCGKNVDQGQARIWLEKAAQAEWPEALCVLAVALLSENDDSKNKDKAICMLQKSLQLGHWPAEEHLDQITRVTQ